MATVIRLQATVLPGGRVEVSDPALPVGQAVQIDVTVPEAAAVPPVTDIVEWFRSLPPGPRSYPTWEEFEKAFQEDRNSWDR